MGCARDGINEPILTTDVVDGLGVVVLPHRRSGLVKFLPLAHFRATLI